MLSDSSNLEEQIKILKTNKRKFMKKTLIIAALIVSQNLFAEVLQSNYDKNHLAAIEQEIDSQCGRFSSLTQLDNSEKLIQIDNGIVDTEYTTVLSGYKRLDQNIFDLYTITVQSKKYDMYDHKTQTWGSYSVESVTCSQN